MDFLELDSPRVVTCHPLIEWLKGAAVMLALVLLLGWGYHVDHVEPTLADPEATLATYEADASTRAYEAGRQRGREEMAATVGDAYRQGRRDALAQAGVKR